MRYHLAQMNVARLRAPLDSPLLADFVEQLAPINAIADGAPGFVWRWAGNSVDMTELLNLSVWENADALFTYTYKSNHVEVFRSRAKWFEPPTAASFAMWWIPAGHQPTAAEAYARLAWLRARGPGPFAFSFKERFPAFAEPPVPEAGESAISWDGRILHSAANTPNGDVRAATIFAYRQQGRKVWATYEGPGVHFGSLVASADAAGKLDMRYQHANDEGVSREGRCVSTPELLSGGKLRVTEDWYWANGDAGRSILIEDGVKQAEFALL